MGSPLHLYGDPRCLIGRRTFFSLFLAHHASLHQPVRKKRLIFFPTKKQISSELSESWGMWSSSSTLLPKSATFLKKEGIQWHFQPPKTPHFGDGHESLVKSTKRALYAALNKEAVALRHPTDVTLRTLRLEISGLLNSRPLTYASSDPDDFRPFTPKTS